MLRRQVDTSTSTEIAPAVEVAGTAEPHRISAEPFTAGAVRRTVLAAALQKPYSLFPLVIGLLGLTAAGLFGSLEAAVVGGIGVLAGLGGWIVDYFFRHDSLARTLLEDHHAARRRQIADQLEALQRVLEELRFDRGADQLERLGEKFDGLKAVLADKMNPGEITYSRYLGVAEQVYLNALDRLHDVVSLLRGIQAIDTGHIDQRLAELGWREGAAVAADSEIAALIERRRIAQEVAAQADSLVAANETAMTALDATTVRLAGIRTRQGRAAVDMETAMGELLRLAQRASLYDIRR